MTYISRTMNWDWDKLQEKRQRQGWNTGNSQNNDGGDPSSSGGNGPDFNKVSDALKRLPELHSGGKIKWILIALIAIWLLSGIYIVDADENGVVLRFGKYVRTEEPGPHYALPFPIETVYRPKVTQVQRMEVSLPSMLTGDENIVNVQFSVQYQIKDPVQYLFNVSNPTAVVRSAAEAAMREVIGNNRIDSMLTDGKLQIEAETTERLQHILDRYKLGVRVLAVQLKDVQPPKEVSAAFNDVINAREDKSRIINEAEAYRNELLPKARGSAAEVEKQAEAYRETRINNAIGESKRFLALMKEYNLAKDITQKRMYFEAMEEILSRPGMEKVILPKGTTGQILPLLPLLQQSVPAAEKTKQPAVDKPATPSGTIILGHGAGK